jgi:hypothetical protein
MQKKDEPLQNAGEVALKQPGKYPRIVRERRFQHRGRMVDELIIDGGYEGDAAGKMTLAWALAPFFDKKIAGKLNPVFYNDFQKGALRGEDEARAKTEKEFNDYYKLVAAASAESAPAAGRNEEESE